MSCLLPVPPGQGLGVLGKRAGRWAGESQSTASGMWVVEPGVVAEEMDAEGIGAVVGAPKEDVPAGCVFSPTGSDPPAPTPRGSFLHQWLLLSSV